MRTKLLALGLLALFPGVPLAVGMAWLFGIGTPGRMNLPRPFSTHRWRSARNGSDVRCSMVADLRHRVGLVGRTRSEVLRLLGPADQERDGLPQVYDLCPSFMDVYILEIRWENGRVADATVRDT